jgi:DNA polymerase phi
LREFFFTRSMSDLQLYWGLSSNNQTERIQAAHSLIESLNNESLDYSLTRLIRGLSSSNKSARLGFTSTLVELVKTAGVDRIIDLLTLEMSSARVGERDGILGICPLILGTKTL